MRMRMVSLVVSAALCSSCAAASRELEKVEPVSINAAMIGGSVVDSASQQPIVGAEIVLLTAIGDAVSDQQSKTFTFAPRGQFRFDDVRPGSYSLRVSASQPHQNVRYKRCNFVTKHGGCTWRSSNWRWGPGLRCG